MVVGCVPVADRCGPSERCGNGEDALSALDREASDLLVFNHSRIAIDKTVNYKGTEKLLEGFAAFVKKHPKVRANLAILEYGPDVARARELAARLGIGHAVRWFPLMARKEVLLGLSLADVACGELGYSYLYGGAITECIAMGKPMIHYRNDADFPAEDLFPILPAYTAEDVLAQLERLKQDLKARGWLDRRRPIPALPERIGVVTSRDGAAFQDFLRTRSLRWPLYPVVLSHTPVQGANAAQSIAAAIRRVKADLVEQSLHHRLQTPRADVFHAAVHLGGEIEQHGLNDGVARVEAEQITGMVSHYCRFPRPLRRWRHCGSSPSTR